MITAAGREGINLKSKEDLIIHKKDVRNFYNATADSYDSLYKEEQQEKYRAALGGDLPERVCILDAGCGTGLFERFIAEQWQADRIFFAVDFSLALLKKAKRKLGSNSHIFFVCSDIDFLPFQRGVFDLCVAFTLIPNIPNPTTTVQELCRVLKNGAILMLSYFNHEPDLEAFLRQSFEKIFEFVRGKERIASYRLKSGADNLVREV